MRILGIRLKNLNSLSGEWSVDLSHPEYVADGIFAITGPTGSGKTTILDAICLALFGRTPRLARINESANEIMSRHCGECFAEVLFQTDEGRYRCHWSQRRANKKPDGRLQSARHELADADTDTIIETRQKHIAGRIEAITGLNFDRFTRSMLLAQGGFAAFLDADPGARGPLLEQITRTEIYSDISRQAHLRCAEEKKKLGQLENECQGILLLDEPERKRLQEEQLGLEKEHLEIGAALQSANGHILWHKTLLDLEAQKMRQGDLLDAARKEFEEFAPLAARLMKAETALRLEGEYTGLIYMRKEQAMDRDRLKACRKSLPESRQKLGLLEAECDRVQAALQAAQAEYQQKLPLIQEARHLDALLAEKKKTLTIAAEQLAASNASLTGLRNKLDADASLARQKRRTLEELVLKLESSAPDQHLVEKLENFNHRFTGLTEMSSRSDRLHMHIKGVEKDFGLLERSMAEQSARYESRKKHLESTRAQLEQTREKLAGVQAGKTMQGIREELQALQDGQAAASKALETIRGIEQCLALETGLTREAESLRQRHSALSRKLEEEQGRRRQLADELESLDKARIRQESIQQFEESRKLLQEGTPCPLCGSEHHPFSQGPDHELIPPSLLQQTRQALASLDSAISDQIVERVRLDKDLEQNLQRRDELARQREHLSRELPNSQPLECFMNISEFAAAEADRLQALLVRLGTDLDRRREQLAAAEKLEAEIASIRQRLDGYAEAHLRSSAETEKLSSRHREEAARINQLQEERQRLNEQFSRELALLCSDLLPFGCTDHTLAGVGDHLPRLAVRRDDWLARLAEKQALEKETALLENGIKLQQAQVERYLTDLRDRQAILDNLDQEHAQLAKGRFALIGEDQPETLERNLRNRQDQASLALEQSREKLQAQSLVLSQSESRIAELLTVMEERASRLDAAEEAFKGSLEQAGFADEASFLAAALPEKERTELSGRQRELESRLASLGDRLADIDTRLEAERAKKLTGSSLAELESAAGELSLRQQAIQQEIGRIRQRLEDDERLAAQKRNKAAALLAQKQEYARWSALDALIGSADGKKFRNFAQEITFDRVIGYANQELMRLTDRYLLRRDGSRPLELKVIDAYQAGTERSTKNLSGGESFLVSLALALGLSRMTGSQVRVESLFLDEGFGTLDEEALDAALDALSGLQRTGKLIGIISHVPALKERISCQIQVVPRPGGKSMLVGPGCRDHR